MAENEQTQTGVLSVFSAAALLTVKKRIAEGRPDLIIEFQVQSKNDLAACRVEFKSTYYNIKQQVNSLKVRHI